MVIWRCAWHRKYHGYPLPYGVTAGQGVRIAVSEGICRSCTVRLRADLRVPPHVVDSTPMPISARLLPAAVIVLLVAAALLLLSRPLNIPAPAWPASEEIVRSSPPGAPRRQPEGRRSAPRPAVTAPLPHDAAVERMAWPEIGGSFVTGAVPVPATRGGRTSPLEMVAFADRSSAGSAFGVQTQ